MNCDKTRRQIDRYVDNELTRTEAEAIEQHLASCSQCRLQFQRRAQLTKLLNIMSTNKLSTDLVKTTLMSVEKIQKIFWKRLKQAVAAVVIIGFGAGIAAGVIISEEPVITNEAGYYFNSLVESFSSTSGGFIADYQLPGELEEQPDDDSTVSEKVTETTNINQVDH